MAAKESSYGSTSASPAPTNVQVIAPATLEAGYTFDAMYDGVTFTVTVPDGGVIKGQRFIVPFAPPAVAVVAEAVPEGGFARANGRRRGGGGGERGIPTGIWRDGLCDCFRHGPFHPHFVMALCFRPCLVGQVMTRMKMAWTGRRTHDASGRGNNLNDSRLDVDDAWRRTFRNIFVATAVFYAVTAYTTTPATLEVDDMGHVQHDSTPYYDTLSPVDKVKYNINGWASSIFGFYVFYILVQLRATLRYVYSIPEESCLCWYQLGVCGNNPREGICGSGGAAVGSSSNGMCTAGVPVGWEDVCCAIWCQLCVAAQMARHTADYDERTARCCNATGVDDWDDDEAYEGVEGGHVGEGSVLVV